MASILEAARDPHYPAEIVLVISNVPDVLGLERAREAGVETLTINHRDYHSRAEFEADLEKVLRTANIELICLAGFMRILSADFIGKWQNRILNIHPSLLPLFRGLHTHEQVLAAGVRQHGCTVHFAVPELDAGPIIAQATVPVLDGDTADLLAARVLLEENKLYPLALAKVAKTLLPL